MITDLQAVADNLRRLASTHQHMLRLADHLDQIDQQASVAPDTWSAMLEQSVACQATVAELIIAIGKLVSQPVAISIPAGLKMIVQLQDGASGEAMCEDTRQALWCVISTDPSGVQLTTHTASPGQAMRSEREIAAALLEFYENKVQVLLWDERTGPYGDPVWRAPEEDRSYIPGKTWPVSFSERDQVSPIVLIKDVEHAAPLSND